MIFLTTTTTTKRSMDDKTRHTQDTTTLQPVFSTIYILIQNQTQTTYEKKEKTHTAKSDCVSAVVSFSFTQSNNNTITNNQ